MSEIRLGIATVIYNRANLIPRLYKALKDQTNKNFVWYIVDDGSTDNTWEEISKIKENEKEFSVVTYRVIVNNRSEAFNKLKEIVQTEFSTDVNDDDIPLPEMVERAYQLISVFPKDTTQIKYCGIAGIYTDLIGKPMFEVTNITNKYVDASNIERSSRKYKKYSLLQDKCEIYKSSILKQSLYPLVENEVFTDDDYVYNRIAQMGYKIRWTNVPLVMREYRKGGITRSGVSLILKNPNSFRISITERHKCMPFPYNYTCLGNYYYTMKMRQDGKKNSISLCAKECKASWFSMLLGIALKSIKHK